MFHTTNIARTHQRSSPHLSLSRSLTTYFLLTPLSLYLPISLSLPLLPSSTLFFLPPLTLSLSPLCLSPSTSPFLFQVCEWWWLTFLSSRTPWNALSECWNVIADPHWPMQCHLMHLHCTFIDLGEHVLGFLGLTGWEPWASLILEFCRPTVIN